MEKDLMSKFIPVEELEVSKLSAALADSVWNMVRGWDRFAQDTIGKQLVRSCDSIGANIIEGGSDGGAVENRRYVRYARRSLQECRYFLRRSHSRELVSQEQAERISSIISQPGPKLSAYKNAIDRRCVPRQPLNNGS